MQATRQHILEILKQHGTATVEDLGKELKLTPVTIRHHLDILRSEDLVQAPKVRRRDTPGRPQHVYSLTDAADNYFPKNYAGLADVVLQEVRDRSKPGEMSEFLNSVAQRMAAEAPAAQPGETMQQRMDRVTKFMNEKGYSVNYETVDGGYLVRTLNCPYRDLAREAGDVCVVDQAMLRALTGQVPQRLESIANGSPACVYLIKNLTIQNQAANR
jgi:predicted ArsR family transcriptional regulator